MHLNKYSEAPSRWFPSDGSAVELLGKQTWGFWAISDAFQASNLNAFCLDHRSAASAVITHEEHVIILKRVCVHVTLAGVLRVCVTFVKASLLSAARAVSRNVSGILKAHKCNQCC